MTGHGVRVCEFGHSHGRCRCAHSSEQIVFVSCNSKALHSEKFGPYAEEKTKAIPINQNTLDAIEKATKEIEAAFSTYTITGTNWTHVYTSVMRDVHEQTAYIRNKLEEL